MSIFSNSRCHSKRFIPSLPCAPGHYLAHPVALHLLQDHGKKMTIADRNLTKSLSNFEIKQPNCTILFIFVFELSFIDCTLSKIVGFDLFWTAVQQKLVNANRKLVFFKVPNTFCQFTVQNCHYFLP